MSLGIAAHLRDRRGWTTLTDDDANLAAVAEHRRGDGGPRAYFCAHGAVSADLSHEDDGSAPLDPADAERIYARAVAGTVTAVEAVALRLTCCSRWHACPPRTPWWFLDAPTSILRWREAVTEIVGLSRTSGFIDDTRALCSIPARHDMARRVDAGFPRGPRRRAPARRAGGRRRGRGPRRRASRRGLPAGPVLSGARVGTF